MVKGNTVAVSCEVVMGAVVFLVPALRPATEQAFVPEQLSPCLLFVMSWYTRGCMRPERTSIDWCASPQPSFPRNPDCPVWSGVCHGVLSAYPCPPLTCRSWESNGVVMDCVTQKAYFYSMLECSSLPSGSIPAAFCSEKVETEHLFLTDGD